MKKHFVRLLAIALATLWMTAAQADCLWQGKSYPTGTRIGGLTCQPDGTWK